MEFLILIAPGGSLQSLRWALCPVDAGRQLQPESLWREPEVLGVVCDIDGCIGYRDPNTEGQASS